MAWPWRPGSRRLRLRTRSWPLPTNLSAWSWSEWPRRALPVFRFWIRQSERRLVGMISLNDLLRARTQNLTEERERERALRIHMPFPRLDKAVQFPNRPKTWIIQSNCDCNVEPAVRRFLQHSRPNACSYTGSAMFFAARVSPRLKYWVGIEGLFSALFRWLARRMPNERQRLLLITIVAGGLCGLAAVAFHISCQFLYGFLIDRAAAAPGHSWIWWTILTPALGGLVAGVGLTYWVPAAAGSGIPQVKTAYTFRFGSIIVQRDRGQVRSVRVAAWNGSVAGRRGADGADLRRSEQLSVARGAAESQESPAHDVGGHGGGHCRGLQRAHRGFHLYAGGTDRQPRPDHALGRDCGCGAGGRGGAQHSGIEPDLSCAQVADLRSRQFLVAGVVCAAGSAGGHCFGGVHRFAAVAACMVQGPQQVPKWVQPAIGGAATGSFAVVAI